MKRPICLLVLAACAAPPCPEPPAAPIDWSDPTASTAWLRSLDGRASVTWEDGTRAAATLVDPELGKQPWPVLIDRLVGLGIVPPDWHLSPGEPLTKGMLSVLLMELLPVRPGLVSAVMPQTPRYAFRECQVAGLVVGSFHDEAVSGQDLLSALTKADILRREGSLDSIRRP